jgi:hypothetical protein
MPFSTDKLVRTRCLREEMRDKEAARAILIVIRVVGHGPPQESTFGLGTQNHPSCESRYCLILSSMKDQL